MPQEERKKAMNSQESYDYLAARPIWPQFYAGALSVKQIVVIEEDQSATLMHMDKRESPADRYNITYGLQVRGVERPRRRWGIPKWETAYDLESYANATPGQRLILNRGPSTDVPFATEPLTAVMPGLQHFIDGLEPYERRMAFDLLRTSLEAQPPEQQV